MIVILSRNKIISDRFISMYKSNQLFRYDYKISPWHRYCEIVINCYATFAKMTEEDILVELNGWELGELASRYEIYRDVLPHIHSFMQTCIKSKENGMSDFVTVFSPRKSWQYDLTFIASMPNNGHDIVMHSLDPSGEYLIEGLTKTRRFKLRLDSARKYTLFYAPHEQFCSKLRELVTEVYKHELLFVDDINFWCLKRENALKLKLMPPAEVYVKELRPEDIPIVNSVWPYANAGSEKNRLDWLKLNSGFGVYLKSNDQLVSWVTTNCLGTLAALQTLEKHKKKGYATLAVIAMSKYLAENRFLVDPCGLVSSGNVASERVFAKLGFRKIYKGQYIAILNK